MAILDLTIVFETPIDAYDERPEVFVGKDKLDAIKDKVNEIIAGKEATGVASGLVSAHTSSHPVPTFRDTRNAVARVADQNYVSNAELIAIQNAADAETAHPFYKVNVGDTLSSWGAGLDMNLGNTAARIGYRKSDNSIRAGGFGVRLNFTSTPSPFVEGDKVAQDVSGATGYVLVEDVSHIIMILTEGTFDTTNYVTGLLGGSIVPTSVVVSDGTKRMTLMEDTPTDGQLMMYETASNGLISTGNTPGEITSNNAHRNTTTGNPHNLARLDLTDGSDIATEDYVDDIIGQARYTPELTNTEGVYNTGEGSEGTYVIVDGILKQEKYIGNTVINVVDGEDIVDSGAVNFDSILGDDYYDSLNNTILTGTGSSMTATNNSGATADMMICPMGGMYYEDYTESQMLVLVQNGYVEIAGTGHKKISTRGKNKFDKNTADIGYYISNTTGLRLIGGVDSNTGYIRIKNSTSYIVSGHGSNNTYGATYDIDKNVVQTGLNYSFTSADNVAYMRYSIPNANIGIFQIEKGSIATAYESFKSDYNHIHPLERASLTAFDEYKDGVMYYSCSPRESIATSIAINITNLPLAKLNGAYILLQDDRVVKVGIIDGSYTTTDAGSIVYELDTQKITQTRNSNLNSYLGGDIITENKFNDIFIYGDGIDLSSYGYSDLDITQATIATSAGELVLDITDFTITDSVATNSDLSSDDLIWLEVEYSGTVIPTSKFLYTQNATATIESLNAKTTSLANDSYLKSVEIDQLQSQRLQFLEQMLTGDDKGTISTEQFSVGRYDDGRETVLGQGDSTTKTMIVLQTDDDVTYTDITTVASSDTGSTFGMFNGTISGKTTYVGGDFKFLGLKVKINTDGVIQPENIIAEYWNGSTWFPIAYMATSAAPPLRQYGWKLAQNSSASEQWRFNHDPYGDDADWVTNTVNGTTKYWARMRIVTAITTDAIIEQIKMHTNRLQVKEDGSLEFMGTSRPVRPILEGLHNTITNTDVNPPNEDVKYGVGMTGLYTDNEFVNGATDGFLLPITISEGLDTSIKLNVELTGYPKVDTAGVVKFTIAAIYISDDFVFDGTKTADYSTSVTDAVPAGNLEGFNQASFRIPINTLQVGQRVILSIARPSGDVEDTLAGNIVIENVKVSGYGWK